jgi:hypothetical protein
MSSRRRAARILGIAQVALLIPLLQCERRMRRSGGPGIIPFELAGRDGAEEILERWGVEGEAAARVSLLLDYPFLVTYAGLQFMGCARACEELRDRPGGGALASAGRYIGPGQIAAGAFDVVENTALLAVLAGKSSRYASLARSAACAKFVLLIAGWKLLALGRLSRLARRIG